MTVIDFLAQPNLVQQAKDYFTDIQSKETRYQPMITEKDPPPVYLNKEIMEEFKPALKQFYFDESKYDTYLEQLNIQYPELKKSE